METIRIHSIESFGTHDGPGIRMVVFLQGCNLTCIYCHNADTICHSGGSDVLFEDIVVQAVKMKPYFGTHGGVTFSGGEPLLQAKQLIPIIEQLHSHTIHVTIDTNGTIASPYAQQIIQTHADLVLFDIKSMFSHDFITITGVDAFQLHYNSIQLRESAQKPYWIRYVVVPGYTDSSKQIEALCLFVQSLQYMQTLQLLPYHTHGIHKWEQLNMHNTLQQIQPPTHEDLRKLHAIFSEYCTVEIG